MLRFIAAAAAFVFAICPSPARAVVTVRPWDTFGLRSTTVAIEIYVDPTTLTAGLHEHLNAYTMTLSCPEFRGPNDPSFVVPANFTFDINSDPTHGYVFTAADPPFDPTSGSSQGIVFLSAAPGTADTDMGEIRNGFGRVFVTVPLNARLPIYTLRIDNDFLSLGGSGGTIEVVGGQGMLIVDPAEPTSAGVLLAAAPFVLRRRRRP